MVLRIVRYPEPVLRARCRTIETPEDEHQQLVADMLETMRAANGVGLAAPQVGRDIQLAVIDVSHNPECVSYFKLDGQEANMVEHMPVVFLNPKIEPVGKEKETDEEGCLSFPGLRSQIRRPADIKVTYQTLDGQTHSIETDGLLARAFHD